MFNNYHHDILLKIPLQENVKNIVIDTIDLFRQQEHNSDSAQYVCMMCQLLDLESYESIDDLKTFIYKNYYTDMMENTVEDEEMLLQKKVVNQANDVLEKIFEVDKPYRNYVLYLVTQLIAYNPIIPVNLKDPNVWLEVPENDNLYRHKDSPIIFKKDDKIYQGNYYIVELENGELYQPASSVLDITDYVKWNPTTCYLNETQLEALYQELHMLKNENIDNEEE